METFVLVAIAAALLALIIVALVVLRFVWMSACVDVIAGDLAKLPIKLTRRGESTEMCEGKNLP